ncbi:MAG: hypothetical protein D084_Lepto4C00066G0001, partial [Leptospirillum sp. Group IV 'UBA BS']
MSEVGSSFFRRKSKLFCRKSPSPGMVQPAPADPERRTVLPSLASP